MFEYGYVSLNLRFTPLDFLFLPPLGQITPYTATGRGVLVKFVDTSNLLISSRSCSVTNFQ